MPRVVLDVSDTWYQRFQEGVNFVCETLDGWDHRIILSFSEDTFDADDLLDQIHAEIRYLRQQIEAWKLPF